MRVNRSIDLEGVHGTINALDFWSEPGCCPIAEISAEGMGAAMGDEGAVRVLVFFHCLWV